MSWADLPVDDDFTDARAGAEYFFIEPRTYHGFTICFAAIEEIESLKEGYGFEYARDLRDMEQMVRDGTRVWFTARVQAYRKVNGYPRRARGEAYLGCCLYSSYDEFHIRYRDDYYMDLVEQAVQEAAQSEARMVTGIFHNLNQQQSFEQKMGVAANVLKLESPTRRG